VVDVCRDLSDIDDHLDVLLVPSSRSHPHLIATATATLSATFPLDPGRSRHREHY